MAIFNRWKLQLGCNLKIKRYFLPAGRQAFIFVVQKIRRALPKKKRETSQNFNPGDRVFFYFAEAVLPPACRAPQPPHVYWNLSLYPPPTGPRGRRPGALPGCSPLLLLGSFRQPDISPHTQAAGRVDFMRIERAGRLLGANPRSFAQFR